MALALDAKKDSLAESIRKKTLEVARQHKASWIELGQYLNAIYRDKHFKEWGFLSFEAYCMKELGIKQQTASKLIKSYSFLEKEEPRLAKPDFAEEASPKKLPNYEAVNLLRLAKENESITPRDYAELRAAVMEEAREPKEVRSAVKKILEERGGKDPAETRRTRRNGLIRRLVTLLNSAKREFGSEGLLPGAILREMAVLAEKLEGQVE